MSIKMQITQTHNHRFNAFENDMRVSSIDHAIEIAKCAMRHDVMCVETTFVDMRAKHVHIAYDIIHNNDVVACLIIYVVDDNIDDDNVDIDEIDQRHAYNENDAHIRSTIETMRETLQRALRDDAMHDELQLRDDAIAMINELISS